MDPKVSINRDLYDQYMEAHRVANEAFDAMERAQAVYQAKKAVVEQLKGTIMGNLNFDWIQGARK